jgi:hypothetical protein
VAERGGEVEVGVGIAGEGEVGVVEEVRVRGEDALDQQRVVGVDGAAQADGRVDPGFVLVWCAGQPKVSTLTWSARVLGGREIGGSLGG